MRYGLPKQKSPFINKLFKTNEKELVAVLMVMVQLVLVDKKGYHDKLKLADINYMHAALCIELIIFLFGGIFLLF